MYSRKIVEYYTVPRTVYVTSDGEEFEQEYFARRHERNITPERKIISSSWDIGAENTYITCYKVENKDDYDYLDFKKWNNCGSGVYDGPGWYMAIKYDGGDYDDSYEIYKVSDYIKILEDSIQTLKDCIDESNT